MNSFEACRVLLEKYAPIYSKALRNETEKPFRRWKSGAWKKPMPNKLKTKILKLDESGCTIEEIAHKVGYSWKTIQKHLKKQRGGAA